MTLAGIVILANAVYFGLGWIKTVLGERRYWVLVRRDRSRSTCCCCASARPSRSRRIDDPNADVIELPEFKPTLLAPGCTTCCRWSLLIWCADGRATVARAVGVLRGRAADRDPADAAAAARVLPRRGEPLRARFASGWHDLVDGLGTGARNMIGIAHRDRHRRHRRRHRVDHRSRPRDDRGRRDDLGGNLIAMLVLVAVICLILGMGMPTTASYIVVSTLMAPVRRRARRRIRTRDAARRRAHVRLLFRIDGRCHAAGRSRRVRRRGDLARRLPEDRRDRVLVQHPHRHPAVHVRLQHRAAADRHPFVPHICCWSSSARSARCWLLRRRDAGLVPDAEPLVRDRSRCCWSRFTLLRPGVLARPDRGAVRNRPGRHRSFSASPTRPPTRRFGSASKGRAPKARTCARRCCCRSDRKLRRSQRLAKEGLSVIATAQGVQVLSVALRSPAAKAGFEQGYSRLPASTSSVTVSRRNGCTVRRSLLVGIVVMLQRRRCTVAGAVHTPSLGTT